MSTAESEQHPSSPAVERRPKTVHLGDVLVSRFILGGNPFSGFSHQNPERDRDMLDWYTMDRIKADYRAAEQAGITTHLGRADNFIVRALREHWNEGGSLIWIAQTCPQLGSPVQGVRNALNGGAKCCFIHGGEMDMRVAQGTTEPVFEAVKMVKDAGLAVGVAGHRTDTIQWAADNLELDFFMTSYYNPSDRREGAEHIPDTEETWYPENREAMCALIQQLPAPAIHYKVMAAGRNDPREAFERVADAYRPGDAVCVGVHTKDNPNMIEEDAALFEDALGRRGK